VVNEECIGVSGVGQTPEVVGADSETPIAIERDLIQEDIYILIHIPRAQKVVCNFALP